MRDDQDGLLHTQVPGLDVLLGGGIRVAQSVVVTGEPGSGKTILASQIAFSQARRGVPVVYATVTSESHDKFVDVIGGFEFFDASRMGEQFMLVSAYPWLKKGPKETRDMLLRTVRERGARLLVFDGFRSVRDLWRDEAVLREFLYELTVGLATSGCTTIIATEYERSRLTEYPEATNVDGIVSLSSESQGLRTVRRARVIKLRGQAHLMGTHALRIDRRGVTIYPRLETQFRASPRRDVPALTTRASFGIPALDKALHGGLPRGTSTLVAGSAGIGKSVLGLHYAAAGASAGEMTMHLSLAETPDVLMARAARLGIDLTPHLRSGRLRMEHRAPIEAEIDELINQFIETISAVGAVRCVLDSVDELSLALFEPDRLTAFLTALVSRLRDLGVTTVFLKKIANLPGPVVDFSDAPVGALAENLVLMRQMEKQGQIQRAISVLAVRDSRFERHVRQFEIEDGRGIRVHDDAHATDGDAGRVEG
jgi:circadian clock protein KaiC